MLLPDNIGISMSIDETSLNGELYTILTNKAGHGKAGTIVAMIRVRGSAILYASLTNCRRKNG